MVLFCLGMVRRRRRLGGPSWILNSGETHCVTQNQSGNRTRVFRLVHLVETIPFSFFRRGGWVSAGRTNRAELLPPTVRVHLNTEPVHLQRRSFPAMEGPDCPDDEPVPLELLLLHGHPHRASRCPHELALPLVPLGQNDRVFERRHRTLHPLLLQPLPQGRLPVVILWREDVDTERLEHVEEGTHRRVTDVPRQQARSRRSKSHRRRPCRARLGQRGQASTNGSKAFVRDFRSGRRQS